MRNSAERQSGDFLRFSEEALRANEARNMVQGSGLIGRVLNQTENFKDFKASVDYAANANYLSPSKSLLGGRRGLGGGGASYSAVREEGDVSATARRMTPAGAGVYGDMSSAIFHSAEKHKLISMSACSRAGRDPADDLLSQDAGGLDSSLFIDSVANTSGIMNQTMPEEIQDAMRRNAKMLASLESDLKIYGK